PLCISISLFSCFFIPFNCLLFIFFYSSSTIITISKIKLSTGISLFSCFFIPFNCFLFILFYSSSIIITYSKCYGQVVWGLGEQLICRVGVFFRPGDVTRLASCYRP